MTTVPPYHPARKHLLTRLLILATAIGPFSGLLWAAPNATVDNTWTSGASNAWNDTTKWTPTPGAGGPSGIGLYVKVTAGISTTVTITLDATKTLGRLEIGDNSATASDHYVLAGGGINFDGNGGNAEIIEVVTSRNDFINSPMTLTSSLDLYNNSNQGSLFTLGGSITGLASSGTLMITAKSGSWVTTGAISNGVNGGNVGLLVDGGSIRMGSAASSYTGSTVVRSGTLSTAVAGNNGSNGAFGNSTTAIELADESSLTTANVSLLTTAGFGIARNINVNSNNSAGTTTIGGSGASTGTFSGIINLNKDVVLTSGTAAITFSKSIVNASGANTAHVTGGASSNVILNSGTANSFAPTAFEVGSGKLSLGASNQIADTTNLTVSGGVFNIVNFSDTVAAVSMTGGQITGTTGILTGTGYDLQAGTVAAKLGGSGILAKTGAGIVILSGINTYTGATNVSDGTLLIQTGGSIASSSLITVSGTGILGGGGTVGAVSVTSGGTLAPGSSPGILSTGNVALGAGSHFGVDLGKSGVTAVAGTDYDQLNVTGTVGLTGVDLALTLNSGIQAGDIFYLVSNDSTDGYLGDGFFSSVNGVATPLAQGAEFTVGGQAFRISYDANWTGTEGTSTFTGGGGNDVALLALVPEPQAGALAIGALGLVVLARRRRNLSV